MFRPSEPIAQSIFAGMAKRRIAQIMRQTGNLHHGTNIAGRIACGRKPPLCNITPTRLPKLLPTLATSTLCVRRLCVKSCCASGCTCVFSAKAAEGSGKNDPVVVDVKIRTQGIGTFLSRRGNGRHGFRRFWDGSVGWTISFANSFGYS